MCSAISLAIVNTLPLCPDT